MEEGGCRNLYRIDIRACRKLLKRRVAAKHQLRVDGRMSQPRINFVEVRPALRKLIRKDIGQGNNPGIGIFLQTTSPL
jgi:hypothetical protein